MREYYRESLKYNKRRNGMEDIYLVTVTKDKWTKRYIVLGISHYDPTGTGAQFLTMFPEKYDGCTSACNRVSSLNETETKEGEPMFPSDCVISAQPLEFEVAGIEEV
jgi:hypothetical protein